MKKHTYIIPYYIDNNNIYILLAKKKFFSSVDGYIHSNSNQIVLIGGHLDKKYENDIVSNIEKEFLEETGYKINKNKVKVIKNCDNIKCYYVGLYNCNNKEYNKFKSFSMNQDNRYVELNELIWVNLKDAKNIIIRHNSSLNIDYMTNQYIYNFIENIKKPNNKWYGINEMKYIYNYYKYNNINKKEIAKKIIFPKILNNDKYFIKKMYNEIKKYIIKNNYYDWFLESIDLFEKNLNNNFDNNKKNESKKQINSNKKSTENKKKYIPPHLRNK